VVTFRVKFKVRDRARARIMFWAIGKAESRLGFAMVRDMVRFRVNVVLGLGFDFRLTVLLLGLVLRIGKASIWTRTEVRFRVSDRIRDRNRFKIMVKARFWVRVGVSF
jgi:hypothetical protein